MDAVYFLKDAVYNEELRYSLRSLEKNAPFVKRVWFVGGRPMGLHPDKQLVIHQDKENKWENVGYMMDLVCQNEDLSEKFLLMNDDFFILHSLRVAPPLYYDATLPAQAMKIKRKHQDKPSKYTDRLEQTCGALYANNLMGLNFELHVPMIINKEVMLKARDMVGRHLASRSVYGNYLFFLSGENIEQLEDQKIVSLEELPNLGKSPFVSTTDRSFERGAVGKYIREMFPDISKFES